MTISLGYRDTKFKSNTMIQEYFSRIKVGTIKKQKA